MNVKKKVFYFQKMLMPPNLIISKIAHFFIMLKQRFYLLYIIRKVKKIYRNKGINTFHSKNISIYKHDIFPFICNFQKDKFITTYFVVEGLISYLKKRSNTVFSYSNYNPLNGKLNLYGFEIGDFKFGNSINVEIFEEFLKEYDNNKFDKDKDSKCQDVFIKSNKDFQKLVYNIDLESDLYFCKKDIYLFIRHLFFLCKNNFIRRSFDLYKENDSKIEEVNQFDFYDYSLKLLIEETNFKTLEDLINFSVEIIYKKI